MLCNATELVCVYKSRVSTSIIISNSSHLSSNHFTSSRMKQVAAVVLFFAVVQLVACQREINKDYCAINHAANVAKLEYIASDLKSLVSSLRQEMDCEKPGQPLNPVESCKDVPRFKGSGNISYNQSVAMTGRSKCTVIWTLRRGFRTHKEDG